ncbi:hypothetical protein [Bifidobacterium sp. SO4]|uniref:hypothetical protein n=1 Tax=Bifidobacterium sp. SO4 TaxID=2809030 RepID=UPI001BDD3B24|nr:hypothetical protein [Bifidobacterium sp. SO4]MBT1170289.1 hypothetical protein [Bifidobacterium sp. SO4]
MCRSPAMNPAKEAIVTDMRVTPPGTGEGAHGSHRLDADALRKQSASDAQDRSGMADTADALDALDALTALDSDRSKLAGSYDRMRVTTVIWVAAVYGLLTLTYWLIPQAYLGRFRLPWNSAWIIFALLAASMLLMCTAMTLTAHAQGIAVQWLPPAPVAANRRYRTILAVRFVLNFIPPVLALVVGYVTDAWWSALAVTAIGAAINGLAEYWELDATVRALKQRTTPQQDTEVRHGIG